MRPLWRLVHGLLTSLDTVLSTFLLLALVLGYVFRVQADPRSVVTSTCFVVSVMVLHEVFVLGGMLINNLLDFVVQMA